MKTNLEAVVFLTLDSVVTLETAKKLGNHKFKPPIKTGIGQVWEIDNGQIIGLYARDIYGNLYYKTLNSNEKNTHFNPKKVRLLTFLPNADDILSSLNETADEWANFGPDDEKNYKCVRQGLPEQEFKDQSRHEACAKAWFFVHPPGQ